MTLTPAQRAEWSERITDAFNLNDIEIMCADLGIDYEELAGDTKSVKVRALVQYCERRGQLNELLAKVKAARPLRTWPALPERESAGPTAGGVTVSSGDTYLGSAHAEGGGDASVTNSFGGPAAQPMPPPTPAKKIIVLFLAANPKSTDRLRLDEEVRTIDERLRLSQFRDRFDLQQQWAVRTSDILDAVLRHKPDIVHFSGHGSKTGELVFEDAAGNAKAVNADALGALFAARKGVRCVVLNACWSDTHANAIAKAVDCVVGMTRSVGDDAAIGFASGFYRSLGERLSVQEAFDLGNVQIMLDGGDEEKTPRLRTRKGVDAGAVVLA